MVRLLIRIGVFLLSCAIGLLAAVLILDRMTIDFGSFVIVVLIFGALQSLLSPWVMKMAHRHASTLLGGVGLISTFLALLVTNLLASGLSIRGVDTWVFACLIVWLVTMLATLFLPFLIVKKHLREPARTGGAVG